MSREYGQYCGLAHALEIVGGRWTLLIVRDLLAGPRRFTDLQEGLPGIPSNVLSGRLRDLEAAGVATRQLLPRGVAYALTDYGRELEDTMVRLGLWGARTMGPRRDGQAWSIHSLALALHGAFHPDGTHDTDSEYELKVEGQTLRVSIADGQSSFTTDRTRDPDAIIDTDADCMLRMLTGLQDIDDAVATGLLRITGDTATARRFFHVFRLAPPIETSATPD